MIQVKGSRGQYHFPALGKIEDAIRGAARGTEENRIFAMLLGGAHSKGLENEDSDWDITLYYLPTTRNLVALRKETFHLLPSDEFPQISENPTVYDCGGEQIEITVAPVRTIGGKTGKELWRNLMKTNMKVIHDFLKDYLVDGKPIALEAKRLRGFLLNDFVYSVKAVDGYFRGYMTSQLKAPGRKADYDKRELASYRTNDLKPVTKAIINGVYIGLSGLAFLERGEVYRNAALLLRDYEQRLFAHKEVEFLRQVESFKKERRPIGGSIPSWLAGARVFRNSIYERIVEAYDTAREKSWIGIPTPAERRRNLTALDEMLRQWMDI